MPRRDLKAVTQSVASAQTKMGRRTKKLTENTTILQWNCRGFRDKAGELQQYVDSLDSNPDILVIQETYTRPKLLGFVTQVDPTERGTAVLVRKPNSGNTTSNSTKGV